MANQWPRRWWLRKSIGTWMVSYSVDPSGVTWQCLPNCSLGSYLQASCWHLGYINHFPPCQCDPRNPQCISNSEKGWGTDSFPGRSLILVPGLLADPADAESGICADLDGGSFACPHSLLDRLHQVLRVAHQHVGCLLIFFGACILWERELRLGMSCCYLHSSNDFPAA